MKASSQRQAVGSLHKGGTCAFANLPEEISDRLKGGDTNGHTFCHLGNSKFMYRFLFHRIFSRERY